MPDLSLSLSLSLYNLFDSQLQSALVTMKTCKITLLSDEYKRKLYEVVSPNQTYYVYYNIFFCSCPAFRREVLMTQSRRVCKHIIATRIMSALRDPAPKEGFMDADKMSAVFMDMSHVTGPAPVADTIGADTSTDCDDSAVEPKEEREEEGEGDDEEDDGGDGESVDVSRENAPAYPPA